MSSMHLSDEQQQRLGSLIAALGQDGPLRERFQTDVREVFNEYGLAELLPGDMQFEARLSPAEVSGFAMGADGHSDFGHWDISHADTHLDLTFPVIGGFRVAPRLGSPA